MKRVKGILFRMLRKVKLNKIAYHLDRQISLGKDEKLTLSLNKELYNIHNGERCFIIGNGPSINTQDLTRLAKEFTFTVNQLSRRTDFNMINSDVHLWTDKRFFDFDQQGNFSEDMLNVMRKVKNHNPNQIVFYSYELKKLVEKIKLDSYMKTYYIGERDLYDVSDLDKIDLAYPIPGFSTVIHYAICIAIYMGFKEIYLLGCDCTSFITTAQAKMKQWDNNTLYGYEVNDIEKKRMEKSNNVYSIEEELRFNANVFKRYRELNELCKKNGIRLLNATKGGLLESIDRVQFESIL